MLPAEAGAPLGATSSRDDPPSIDHPELPFVSTNVIARRSVRSGGRFPFRSTSSASVARSGIPPTSWSHPYRTRLSPRRPRWVSGSSCDACAGVALGSGPVPRAPVGVRCPVWTALCTRHHPRSRDIFEFTGLSTEVPGDPQIRGGCPPVVHRVVHRRTARMGRSRPATYRSALTFASYRGTIWSVIRRLPLRIASIIIIR